MTKPILFLNKLILEVYPCSLYVYKAPLPPKINAYLNYFTPDLPLESRLSFLPPYFLSLLFLPTFYTNHFSRSTITPAPLNTPPLFYLAKLHYPNILLPENICNIIHPPPLVTLPLLPTHKFASQWSNIMKSQQKFVAMR